MEVPEKKAEAKMELIKRSSELMPGGQPLFLEMIKYPMIKDISKDLGHGKMMKVLFLMLKDFCSSMNVVRNMNEDQMIEGAAMLLDECGNFRVEDYTVMFSLAKKGSLVKIYDRIDLQVLTEIMDRYWDKRNDAANSGVENEINHIDSLGSTARQIDALNPQDSKLIEGTDKLSAALGELKNKWKDTQ